jgi:hypothetical protein
MAHIYCFSFEKYYVVVVNENTLKYAILFPKMDCHCRNSNLSL